MPKPFSNNPHKDADRREIWNILMTEDFEGYCSGDFSKCKTRFDEDFCGYNGNQSLNPKDWKVDFPTLEPYEKIWVHSAKNDVPKNQPKEGTLIEFFDRSVRLDQILIGGDRAAAHKTFFGSTPLKNGGEYKIAWQTMYFLRKRKDGWKITGFVGFLPYDGK